MRKAFFPIFLLILLSACSKDKKTDEAALKMQEMVINISNYTRGIDPDFIIIPQNGVELAYHETDPGSGINEAYVNAVSGIGIEELFYNTDRLEDDGRLAMLQPLSSRLKVMVADYLGDPAQLPDAIQLSTAQGFICFPRAPDNYAYRAIPAVPLNENADTIRTLSDVRNYLYLISTDNFASIQEMVDAVNATNYDLLLIDPYFNEAPLSATDVMHLKTKANGSPRLVIAYVNAGAAENWRYYWQDDWKLHHPDWLKKKYEGYDDEIWVEYWNQEWQDILYGSTDAYLDRVISAGFDGAYLDNVEAYYFLYHD